MELYRLKLALVVIGSDSGSETSSPPSLRKKCSPYKGKHQSHRKASKIRKKENETGTTVFFGVLEVLVAL